MEGLEIWRTPSGYVAGTGALGSFTAPADHQIPVSLRLNDTQVTMQLQQPLEAFVTYKVLMSALAPTKAQVSAHGAPVTWRLQTLDGGELPLNTNDGASAVFKLSEEYEFEVLAPRAPPGALVEVRLLVNPRLSAPITEFRIVAPPGFNFTSSCLVSGYPQVVGCVPDSLVADNRWTALLGLPEAGINVQPPDLRVMARTPSTVPVVTEWFIQGRDVYKDTEAGWGRAAGFQIIQMPDTRTTFPAVPAIRARMLWIFRPAVMIAAGGYIEVELPPLFVAHCGADAFHAHVLPHSDTCQVLSSGGAGGGPVVVVSVNTTIVPDVLYTFEIGVTPPAETPAVNEFALTIKDSQGAVRDAARDIPGPQIQSLLRVAQQQLLWTSSRPSRESMVTLGFRVLEELPDVAVSLEQQVGEILIVMPSGFEHRVNTYKDFTLSSNDMPLLGEHSAGNWLDLLHRDRLRLILDLNRSSWTRLPVGVYQFRFPIQVPGSLPEFNVWQMALCRPDFGGCLAMSDSAVIVQFAQAGFTFDQESPPGAVTPAAGGAVRHGCAAAAAAALVLLCALPAA